MMESVQATRRPIARYAWTALGIVFVGQLSNAFSVQVIAPLAPLLQPELGLTKTQVGLFSSATFAGAWVSLLVGGLLVDRFGAGRAMAVGQLFSGAMVAALAAVSSFPQSALVMAAAGLGMGIVSPAITKAVVDWFPSRIRATAMGIKQSAVPLGGMLLAATLPALGLAIGWRYAAAAVGIAIVLGGAVAFRYREAPASEGRAASRPGARSGLAEVLRNRKLWALSVAGTLMTAGQVATVTYLALYFSEVVLVGQIPDVRDRVVAAGVFLAICQAGGFVARVAWGVASDRALGSGRATILAVAGGLSILMSLALSAAVGWPHWLLALTVFATGATVAGFAGVFLAAAAEAAGPRHTGAGVGLSLSLIHLGNFFGAPLFGIAVDASGSYQFGWIALALLFALGTIVAAASRKLS